MRGGPHFPPATHVKGVPGGGLVVECCCGCDGRFEKKYEKKYEYSRFLLLFAAETRFAGLLSHADEC